MSGHTPSELVTLLRERSLALSGRSIDRGCQDSGISANLCDEAADLIAANEAKIEALEKALRLFVDRFHANGEWDDGCFYYRGTSASEFQEPLKIARAALRTAAGEK